MEKKIALNINYDSLFFPLDIDRTSVRDPSYFVVADRVFAYINRLGIRASIYVIGRDLEHPEVAARVRSWAEAGHEIGNHTWSHHHNLGGLPEAQIREEIVRAHDLITQVTGREPRGFIAPAWTVSSPVVAVLRELRYVYDTSIFPSPLIVAAMTKLFLNGRKQQRYNASWWRRKDKRVAWCAPRQPYFFSTRSLVRPAGSGVLSLPLPTLPYLRIPCWQTMAFYLPQPLMSWLIRETARQSDAFYYLMHPADLVDFAHDVPAELRKKYDSAFALFERLNTPIEKKRAIFENALETLKTCGTFVTVEELARDLLAQKTSRSL